MKKTYFIIALALILLIMAACASNGEKAAPKMVTKYDIALTKVVKIGDATARSKPAVADTTIVNKLRYRWEDDTMRTIWSASENGFEVTFYNSSEKDIVIDWAKGQYLDYDNIGHKLLLTNINGGDKSKPLPSSTLAAKGNLTDIIFSADNSNLSSLLNVYVRSPLLPTDYATAVRYNGKEMKITLPITIAGNIYSYEHTFKIIGVRQIAAKSSSWFGM